MAHPHPLFCIIRIFGHKYHDCKELLEQLPNNVPDDLVNCARLVYNPDTCFGLQTKIFGHKYHDCKELLAQPPKNVPDDLLNCARHVSNSDTCFGLQTI